MSYDPEFIARSWSASRICAAVASMMMTRMLLLRIFAIASGIVGVPICGGGWATRSGRSGNAHSPGRGFQIALGLYRNRPTALTSDEQALQLN